MTEDETEAVVAEVANRLGIGLVVTDVVWAGARSRGMRLAGIDPSQSFAIGLELIARKAEAFLVMDRFAGQVIRAMESIAASPQSTWPAMIAESEERGIRTTISINDVFSEGAISTSDSPWHSLEIDCSKRVSRMDPAPLDSLVEVASVCMGMTLSALVIEWSDVDQGEMGRAEGAISHVVSTKYERSPVNRFRCIQYYGPTCWVCDEDFGITYGEIGTGFIEVHHRTPVSQLGPDYVVEPRRDLIPLCSNCHSMIHRRNPPFTPMELRARVGKASKEILSRS